MIRSIGTDGKADPHADFYARIMHGNLLAFDRKMEGFVFNTPFF